MAEFGLYVVSAGGGEIALCPIPGGAGDYASDLAAILRWAPALLITMTTEGELAAAGAGTLADDLAHAGIAWRHVPVADFGTPEQDVAQHWPEVSEAARAALSRGERVLVHCKGGCGRSGMAVLRIMVDAGEAPEMALARLRQVRPCAVETEAQMDWAVRGE
ncbi:protein-tyrosine phosphatase family protein [Marivivens marinus]|uniref:protein-tyrosine phosphatase family protein n=1 Tax=Marivivens marinus TaxID=3110173 RepID=UPI003B8457F7